MEYLPDIIVVIPSYNEPEVMQTLQSLFACERGNFRVGIILLVNSYRISNEEVRKLNRRSYEEALRFAGENNSDDFRLSPRLVEDLPGHQTGAGLPRKLGMDEAIRHFGGSDLKKKIIVSLDADTTVAPNYLTELYKAFCKERLKSATLEFHHPVEHLPTDSPLRRSTELYERYLRYYRQALEYTGFPYAYYTIGSAFAVTAQTYLQVGGMGKQQAGEDFYFLHKVFPLGNTRLIDTTCVYPKARTSDRVPFGTGPALARMMQEDSISKLTYTTEAFGELKQLFDMTEQFYRADALRLNELLDLLPSHTREFLIQDDFSAKIQEIREHTACPDNFRKRFFSYFTAFKILKYLNAVHPAVYPLSEVDSEQKKLSGIG